MESILSITTLSGYYAVAAWALLEALFMTIVYAVSYGKYTYSLTLNSYRLWRGIDLPNVHSPQDILTLSWSVLCYARFQRSRRYWYLDSYVRQLNMTKMLLRNRFKLDDDAQTAPISYEICHQKLLKELLVWTLKNPTYSLLSLSKPCFAQALIHVKDRATIDHPIYGMAEVAFMLDEIIFWYNTTLYHAKDYDIQLKSLPFFVPLAVLCGYSNTDIHEELLTSTRWIGGNLRSVKKKHLTDIREDLGIA